MAVLDTMRTDIMHKAAVTIQRHARGLVVRRKVNRIRRAVIKIQVNLSRALAVMQNVDMCVHYGISCNACVHQHLQWIKPLMSARSFDDLAACSTRFFATC